MRQMLASIAAVALLAVPASAAVEVGKPAPNFQLNDADGRVVKLSDYRGKTVVLEWNNPGCPYVQKHYESGNMQKTQAEAAKVGAVWLTINSGAPGKQGYMTGPQAKAFVTQAKARPAAYLLDPKGVVGRGYDAKTTPHMYVIDGGGRLVYAGGIDDKPTSDQADISSARNHVLAALAELRSGKSVSVPTSRPYGCTVKYSGS